MKITLAHWQNKQNYQSFSKTDKEKIEEIQMTNITNETRYHYKPCKRLTVKGALPTNLYTQI